MTDLGPDRLDADSLETLSELGRMKAELNALPPVTPDPAVWEAIRERTAGRSRPGWLDVASPALVTAAQSPTALEIESQIEQARTQLGPPDPHSARR